jgi:signal peptidase I
VDQQDFDRWREASNERVRPGDSSAPDGETLPQAPADQDAAPPDSASWDQPSLEGLSLDPPPPPEPPSYSGWPADAGGSRDRVDTGPAFSRFHVWKDELVAWVKTLLSAAVYATLIVTFGFQVARVEGQSMAPTLEDQDRLIVNKLAYRLGPPRRGDIVMLYYPIDPDKSFVKRVIAEEGDTVKIEDGRVYVNDVPMAEDFVLPEYRSHDDHPPLRVKDGYYYVLGDHRSNSSDSRTWGEVPKKYIIGKVQLRWWPIPNATIFRNP